MIAIVGGGIAGLAAAFELTRRGIPFVLLEAADRMGGLVRTEHVDGFVIDAGADSILVQKPAGLQLCDQLGLSDRLMPTSPPRTAFVLKRGRLYALPSPSVLGIPTTAGALRRYDLLDVPSRARLAVEPLIPRRPGGDESVASFFRRRFGQAAVDLIAEPLLGGIHAGDVEQLSMSSVFPRMIEAERRPGGVLRNVGSRGRPAADGMFRSLRGGMGELVTAIEARLPAGCARLRTVVDGLAPLTAGRWLATAGGERFDARAVIVAAPAYVAARLLAAVDRPAADLCAAVPYVSTASVALGWRRDEIPHPLAGSGFVVARRHNPLRITACTWVSSKWEHRAPAGHALLRVFLGGAHDPTVVDCTDAELVGTAVREVSGVLGISTPPMLARVIRWPNAGAQHVVGHRARMTALAERLRGLPGLFVAGSGYDSIGVPDCVAHGRQVAGAAADYVTINRT